MIFKFQELNTKRMVMAKNYQEAADKLYPGLVLKVYSHSKLKFATVIIYRTESNIERHTIYKL